MIVDAVVITVAATVPGVIAVDVGIMASERIGELVLVDLLLIVLVIVLGLGLGLGLGLVLVVVDVAVLVVSPLSI